MLRPAPCRPRKTRKGIGPPLQRKSRTRTAVRPWPWSPSEFCGVVPCVLGCSFVAHSLLFVGATCYKMRFDRDTDAFAVTSVQTLELGHQIYCILEMCCETRTRNPLLRRAAPYPLGHASSCAQSCSRSRDVHQRLVDMTCTYKKGALQPDWLACVLA